MKSSRRFPLKNGFTEGVIKSPFFKDTAVSEEVSPCPFLLSVIPLILCGQKSPCPATEYSGHEHEINKLNRTLRSFEMLETISFDDAKSFYSSGNVPIVCPRCGLKMKMTDKKMLKFISNKCTCSRCLKTIKTGRYIFDWEKVDFVFLTNDFVIIIYL